ncbi:MAG: hypothetical protein K2X62_06295 [Beijerinckiaceae bacterium]|jgi:hypothetical protein|nr:hypothetical protein [Beijerinckiaceae bacterium]MDO9442033.1 hypothetical protein [Beijerinckiaceae bacterium]
MASRDPNVTIVHATPRLSDQRAPSVAKQSTQQAIVLLVRPGLADAHDLEGRRVSLGALGATSESVRKVVSEAVHNSVITSDVSSVSEVERLVRGDVDAILVGIGPALSESVLASTWVGAYGLMQIPLN